MCLPEIRPILRAALVAGIVSLVSLDSWAASFDCKKASAAIEKMICSDPQLSELDTRLALSYKRLLEKAANPDSLKAEQRTWLAIERSKCATLACLKAAYQRRLAALDATTPGAPAPGEKAPPSKERSCSFTRAPFVNPRIIEDLSTWLSDDGEQVVAINLTEAQESNRYFGDVATREVVGRNPYVYFETPAEEAGERGSEFGYRHIGRTAAGVDVLLTMQSGGGSGVFENLLLLRMEPDDHAPAVISAGGNHETMTFRRKRLLLRKLGEIGLGDRWDGPLKVMGNDILIGKDTGPLSRDEKSESRVVRIDFRP
jgi:uncharacterized protein